MAKRKIWTIYRITNIVNGKTYIGVTVRSVRARWQAHLSEARCATPDILKRRFILAAIRKYGPDNFEIHALRTYRTLKEAKIAEIEFIAQYACFGPDGYNATKGGDGINPMAQKAYEMLLERNSRPEGKERARALASLMNSLDTEWGKKRSQATANRNKRPDIREALSKTSTAWNSDPVNRELLRTLALARYTDPSMRKKNSDAGKLAHATNPAWRAAVSAARSGTISITDGTINKWIRPSDPIPEGWRRGRIHRNIH